MATTARELIERISELTAQPEPDVTDAAGAVTALGYLGRALKQLATDHHADETRPAAHRRAAVQNLARVCRAAAAQGPTTAGRLPDLAGAVSDLLGRPAPTLQAEQRWALAVEIGATAHACVALAARFAPYTSVLALRRVHRAHELLSQAARIDPPAAAAHAPLDRAVPAAAPPPANAPASVRTVEAAAGLLGALEHETRAGTLDLYGVLAACAAAETTARHAATLASNVATTNGTAINGTNINGTTINGTAGRRAPQAWQIVQAALIRFDDGSRYRSATISRVTAQALRLQQAITALAAEPADSSASALLATQYVTDQLPALAGQVETAVTRWSETGVLFALARSLPRTEDRVDALIRNAAVMVTPRDVGAVLVSARVAARLSGALALELDRSAHLLGHQPHPHLIAALAADLRPMITTQDASWVQRLASRVHAVESPARDTVTHAHAPVR